MGGALPDRAGVRRRAVRAVQPAGRAHYWRTARNLAIKDYNHGRIKVYEPQSDKKASMKNSAYFTYGLHYLQTQYTPI